MPCTGREYVYAVNLELQVGIEEDGRLHAEQLNAILSQGHAETTRVRKQLTGEGEQ